MKRFFSFFFVIIVLLCSVAVPCSALSYDGEEFPQSKLYAVIPWTEIAYSASNQTWRFAPFGSTYFRTSSAHGQVRDPSYAESTQHIAGWTYTDGEEPSPEVLTVKATQTYYSQPSIYYANFINYNFVYPGSQNNNVQVVLHCRNLHVTYTQWDALSNYCRAKLPGTALFDISVAINYYGVDPEQNALVPKNIYFERQALVGGTQYKIFPSWEVFTAGGLDTFSNGYMIQDITLTFDIQTYQGNISIGNLYYGSDVLRPDIPIFEKEVIVEKVVIKEVPQEDLNLFNWFIEPIQKFFEIEFFPGISLGAVAGIFAAIFVVLALIKLWGH